MLLEHWRSAVEKRFPVLYCPFVNTASWHLLTGLLLSEYALWANRQAVRLKATNKNPCDDAGPFEGCVPSSPRARHS